MKRAFLVISVLSLVALSACSSKDEHAGAVAQPDAGGFDPDATAPDTGSDVAMEASPSSCSDGVMNNDETDIDCGGKSCKGCEATGKCKAATDCASMICTGNVCAAAKCDDKIQNGNETDVDCGNAPLRALRRQQELHQRDELRERRLHGREVRPADLLRRREEPR
jgi:hypothetical protein